MVRCFGSRIVENYHDIYRSTIHKLNESEGLAIAIEQGYEEIHIDASVVSWLSEHWKQPVILTRGENGAIVCDGGEIYETSGVHFIQEIDIVGAGDAFLAGLVASTISGATLYERFLYWESFCSCCLPKIV